jgi:iron-sulfur cluster repair protein YtfE (RIC family)
MSQIIINDNTYQSLKNAAKSRNISIENLLEELAKILEEEARKEKFEESRKYVRNRYKDLYQKLA